MSCADMFDSFVGMGWYIRDLVIHKNFMKDIWVCKTPVIAFDTIKYFVVSINQGQVAKCDSLEPPSTLY